MIPTVVAVLLRILSNPLGNVFQKQLVHRGHPPLAVNFLTFLFLALLCIVPAATIDWTRLPIAFWHYCLLAGVVGATGNAFLVKALQTGDLSILGPVNSYKSVVGMIGGFLLLGEIPNTWGIAGVALIITGSYFVLGTLRSRFSFALFRCPEIRYRLWAMILTAIEAVFIKKIILHSDTLVSFIVWCWFGALFSGLLLLLFRVPVRSLYRPFRKNDPYHYLALILSIGTMQYTTNYVFDHLEVGYALALFQLSSVVSILLGYRIFHETGIRKKLIGAGVMIIGSALIILCK